MFSVRQKLKFYIYIYVCVYVYTNSRTPLTRRWLYGSPIIRNGLVLRVNISIYFYGLKSSPFFKYTIIIIIIFLLHGLGRLTRSGIDALSSFAGASTVSSYSTFVVEGVFRVSDDVRYLEVVDPVLFVFESHVLYSRDLQFFSYDIASYFIQSCVSCNTS